MTVTCRYCGQTWPRDPALEVECPVCQARVGVKCRRPSGHRCVLHAGRDQRAMDEGFLQRCPRGPYSHSRQFDLFSWQETEP